ncbi:glycosyltransferase family 32 protein [Plenodomus tracheiphilus IPT5]|uniref:Glycosyltransferase family 32 protein n=1 Tax=Plenodomus tracheiphilus IPT5 TaxID=1408161 RepID=A0A6A7AW62_9PLEO|nr:glycosyltransferase family 32 protein [Plenodomus tracheiphilus IPT5]
MSSSSSVTLPPRLSFSTRYRTAIKLALFILPLTLLTLLVASLHPISKARTHGILRPSSAYPPIPRIVHYVHLQKSEHTPLSLPFSSYLSIFAAVLYIQPTKIYIHTDYNTTAISDATEHGDRWTHKLLTTWPELLEWNPVTPPTYAGPTDTHHIDAIQHKSDFVRWDQIASSGGIYLDFDVIALKPLDPLLNAGFAFIAGRQYGNEHEGGSLNGTINNGAFMSVPNSAMSTIVKGEQHAGFDGKWESNLVANTRTAEYLVNVPYECLILDRHAFAPTHWFADSKEGTDNLFRVQEGPPSPEPEPLPDTPREPVKVYEAVVRNRRRRREWEFDWSSSYLLHAFSTGGYQRFIHPRLLLERRSNYGVAVWAIVKEMVDRGLIEGTEGEAYGES